VVKTYEKGSKVGNMINVSMVKNRSIADKVIGNIEKVIVGKRDIVELTFISLICGGHILIEDVPGVGKTSLAYSLAKSINCSFNRIQFTPDVMPSDITGFSMYNQKTGEFEFRPGSIMSHIVLADEINRATPKTQSSLLEVMEKGQVTVDGVTYKVPTPFMVLATQNPVEYLGTYPLPEAQLDRFFMKISIGYPSPADEAEILARFQVDDPLEKLMPVVETTDIIRLQEDVKNVYVDKTLNRYIVDIINGTRVHKDIAMGASPRGSLFLLRAAQAWALYNKRNFVIPDDIKKMAVPVVSHRIMLKQEAKLRGRHSEDIISEIINKIKVPVVDRHEA